MEYENSSCIQPSARVFELRVWQYTLYVLTGAVGFLLNLITTLSIVKYRALRKVTSYQVIGCLSFADAIFALGFVVGGAYRITLFKLGAAYYPIPRIWCMFTPQSFLWCFGHVAAPLMLVVVSWHRLTAVTRPFYFISHAYREKVHKTLYSVFGMGAAGWAIYCPYSIMTASTPVAAYCSTNSVLQHDLLRFQKFIIEFVELLSCAIYGRLVYSIHKHNAAMAQEQDHQFQQTMREEHKITVTLGFSTLITFVLVCLPHTAWHILQVSFIKEHFPMLSHFSSYFFILVQCNGVANFFLYGLRQKEMGKAIKGLLTAKHLPENLRDWHVTVPHAW